MAIFGVTFKNFRGSVRHHDTCKRHHHLSYFIDKVEILKTTKRSGHLDHYKRRYGEMNNGVDNRKLKFFRKFPMIFSKIGRSSFPRKSI